ncbi:MAG TPA: DNA repair protein RadA [Ktedonobacterales bacterium]|nr:DNA repair protein RadA [Ktedonobacterales bacterium]
MPKPTTKFVCQQCGFEAAKWMGRCTDCGAWNTMVETVVAPRPAASAAAATAGPIISVAPISAPEVSALAADRRATGSPELDRTLGGGLMPGSLVLLGGEPGIGKSSLMLQVAGNIAETGASALYVCAEESPQQVKLRAERLGALHPRLFLLPATEIEAVTEQIEAMRPALVVVDSIQTVATSLISSAPGSVSQVRDCALQLMRVAKRTHIPICLIGHVTKEGAVAGPRTLEHMVDAVLYLEGERFQTFRLLRGVKNRFGATHEVGVFEMRGDGMVDVTNPSGLFLAERSDATGSAVVVSMEGTRPLLVETQALVTPTVFGAPRQTATGVDRSRLQMLLAVLTKRVGLALTTQDVFVNVVGGFELTEPAVDLGVALAIASNFVERRVAADLVALGEVGLGGELRAVPRLEQRVREAVKLGFRRVVAPPSRARADSDLAKSLAGLDVELLEAATLSDAVRIALESAEANDTQQKRGDARG